MILLTIHDTGVFTLEGCRDTSVSYGRHAVYDSRGIKVSYSEERGYYLAKWTKMATMEVRG